MKISQRKTHKVKLEQCGKCLLNKSKSGCSKTLVRDGACLNYKRAKR